MSNPSKFHPNLVSVLETRMLRARTGAPSAPVAADSKIPIIVKWRDVTSAAPAASPQTPRARESFTLFPGSAHDATRAEIDALSDRDDVELIWHDLPVKLFLDQSVPLIGAPLVWAQGFTGKGIKVAIVDTGIDPNHPDLTGRVLALKNFVNSSGTGLDDHGHGTHVAGIVGGTGAASGGRYKGVAPEVAFIAAKVLDQNGFGSDSSVIAGMEWAIQQGAQAINLSLGNDGSCDGTDALSVACDAAVTSGIVVCVAAGNAGPGASTVGSPGCAKLVITVGAMDKTDAIANFSSRGPTADGRIKPDICYPGVSITSCRAAGTAIGGVRNNFYTVLSGTSMATPHAVGAAALLLQKFPAFTPAQIKDATTSTAVNLGLDPNTQGAGRGNVYQASLLRSIKFVSFAPTTVEPNSLITVQITVFNGNDQTLATQGPNPGFVYEEGETFYTRGFPDIPGAFRVGVDFDGRTGIDHPFRWGLGAPLLPGQTATITGQIRLKVPQSRNYWTGLVQEQVAWISDRMGAQKLTVQVPQTAPPGSVVISGVTMAPTTLNIGNYLVVAIAVHNGSAFTLTSEGPDPGFIYEEGDTFETRGFVAKTGAFRVGLDYEGRTGIDHPFRWGLGTSLAPGQSTVVTGAIHLLTPQSRKYWAGLVQEYVQWMQDQQGAQTIAVKPGPIITAVTFTPTSLAAGNLLNVSITVRNDGNTTIQTQDPAPGFSYAEGETFLSRGFAATNGAFRVAIDFDSRSGIDHPYRWGLGAPLAPGATATIAGSIRLTTSQSQSYWAGLVQEQIAWLQDHQGMQAIVVTS